MRELAGFFIFKTFDGGHPGFGGHIGKKKVCLLLQYERAHPNAPLCKISCLYDKMHTPSWIMHHSAGLSMLLIIPKHFASSANKDNIECFVQSGM